MKTTKSLALALLLSVCALGADVTGAWVAKVEGRQGRSMEMTFHLKADGGNLTGTVSGARGGETAITDGKVEGDKVSFQVKREFQGRSAVLNYEGVVAGDEIKFKQSVEGGQRPPREFTAKRK
jgi:hypothetical protein